MRTFNVLPSLATLALILLTSCGTATPVGACLDNGDCDEGEACLLETCQPVQCLASTDCNLREWCDDRTYVCRAGCSADLDCEAGESCNVATNTCESYGCRDTDLDCSIGEICSAATGECVRDPGGHCDRCEPDAWGAPQGTCNDNEAFCLYLDDGFDTYCLLECSAATDCPRGYECVEAGDFDQDGRDDSVCYAYCPLLYENGWK